MSKKIVTIAGNSVSSGSTYYTCPSNTVAKVIMSAGQVVVLGVRNGNNTLMSFSAQDVFKRNTSNASKPYLIAGQTLRAEQSNNNNFSLILVEETIGVQ